MSYPVGTAFRENTLIETFNEFDRFKQITIFDRIFEKCSSLKAVNLVNITNIVGSAGFPPFLNTKIENIILINVIYVGHYIVYNSKAKYLLIGNQCETMEQYMLHMRPSTYKACVILAETPPSIKGNYSWGSQPIYVPDNSVEVYKAAPIWINKASTIRKLSDFTTDFPDSGLEEYLPKK